jgi:hypothetical protein
MSWLSCSLAWPDTYLIFQLRGLQQLELRAAFLDFRPTLPVYRHGRFQSVDLARLLPEIFCKQHGMGFVRVGITGISDYQPQMTTAVSDCSRFTKFIRAYLLALMFASF